MFNPSVPLLIPGRGFQDLLSSVLLGQVAVVVASVDLHPPALHLDDPNHDITNTHVANLGFLALSDEDLLLTNEWRRQISESLNQPTFWGRAWAWATQLTGLRATRSGS